MVRQGDKVRLLHEGTNRFLAATGAESQLVLVYDQPQDARQTHGALSPEVTHPEWKTHYLEWIIGGYHGSVTEGAEITYFPSIKGDITFTNVGTKEKLHSHYISVFGADAYEVTAYHGNDHNNHWAISNMSTHHLDASHGSPARPPLGT